MLIELKNMVLETESIESLFTDEELKTPRHLLYLKSGKYYTLDQDELDKLSARCGMPGGILSFRREQTAGRSWSFAPVVRVVDRRASQQLHAAERRRTQVLGPTR